MEQKRTGRITLKTRLLPVLIVLLVVLQLAVPYQGWVVLLVGLGGAWAVAWLWARALARGLDFKREMRFGWAQVGDRLEERFTLANAALAPAVWAEVVDHSAMPDYHTSRVTGCDGRSVIQWRTRSLCTRRGVFTLGPTTLRTGDPFGIYSVAVESTSSTTLMVLPPVIPLPAIKVAPGGRSGEGRPRATAAEHTVSAASAREYVPGDSLRSIHWLTTAHRGALFVRLFDNLPASDWWIILDMDRRCQAGQGQDSTVEHAITLAASLTDRGLRERQAVGLGAHGSDLVWLPPQPGDPQRWSVLRALALLKPGALPLADLVERMRPALGRHASLIIITSDTGSPDGGVPRWLDGLLRFKRRGIVPTVLLLDPGSYPPAAPPPKPDEPGVVEPASVWLDRPLPPAGSAQRLSIRLAELDIASYGIDRGLFLGPEVQPGHEGEWEWRIMPTGMAVPVRQPRNLDWRTVS